MVGGVGALSGETASPGLCAAWMPRTWESAVEVGLGGTSPLLKLARTLFDYVLIKRARGTHYVCGYAVYGMPPAARARRAPAPPRRGAGGGDSRETRRAERAPTPTGRALWPLKQLALQFVPFLETPHPSLPIGAWHVHTRSHPLARIGIRPLHCASACRGARGPHKAGSALGDSALTPLTRRPASRPAQASEGPGRSCGW